MVKHSSRIELKQSAYKNNVNFIRKKIGEHPILSAVVKANAYGHGIEAFVPMAEKCGVKHFSVASAFEAEEVLAVCKPDTEIMIMGIIYKEDIAWAVEHNISFFVYNYDRLDAACQAAKEVGKAAKVHIEVETGANRTGMQASEFPKAITFLKKHKEFVEFEGLCTHYAGAESITNYLRIQDQIKLIDVYSKQFEAAGLVPKYKHTACSAALISYPETQMDMVRVGILLYGYWPSKETFIFHQRNTKKGLERAKDPLKRVIRWASKVMSTKDVPMGEFIGYGTSYQAAKNMRIATVPVGYAYGFARSLSNQGRVIIRGKRVAVIGTINMNLLVVDITEIKGVEKGDEVVLIGREGKVQITVASFGELSNQLNYELLSRLPFDIPRIVNS